MREKVEQLIQYLGGKENVKSVAHCVTRLRFVLYDESKANIKKIESLDFVKGTFTQAGQFQVIIGNNVNEVYAELTAVGGFDEVSKSDIKRVAAEEKLNFFQQASAFLSEIFMPIVPALIIGGLILGFRNIIGDIKISFLGEKTFVEMGQFWKGLHSFLWLIGEAIFAYLPVHIVWSANKKMGGTPVLGIVIGITLVSPQLLNSYGVRPGVAIPFWDFGIFTINMIGYQAQVLPALAIGLFSGWFEKKLRKVIWQDIQMVVIPFLVLIISVLLAHIVVGPIGWKLGSGLAAGVMWIFNSLGFMAGAIYGFFYAPLVITGMHHSMIPVDLQLQQELGGVITWPVLALSNICQGAAVMAVLYLKRGTKDAKLREVAVPAWISAWFGVTEPAMFGVNLKWYYPFLASMIGAGISGAWSVGTGVLSNGIGVGGIPGILSIKPEHMVNFGIAMILGISITFVLTLVLSKYAFKSRAVKV